MIEVNQNVALYMYASNRHNPENGFLVAWLFAVIILGTGTSIITVLSWMKGILMGFNRNMFGATLILNMTIADLVFIFFAVFTRGLTVAADRWLFGYGGCAFYPMMEEYLTITRTISFLTIALYPSFCNMPSRDCGGRFRSGALLFFIWTLGLLPVVAAILTGAGMHIEYTSGYGGCAIHSVGDTNYRPALILFSNMVVQGFLIVITACNALILYRKKRLVMRPTNATAPPQTVACWLCMGAIVGLIPFIGISLYCVLPGVVYEELSPSINLVQLCWYYGSILLTPFILYHFDHNYRQYFRYLLLGRDSVDDKRILAKTKGFWFRPSHHLSDPTVAGDFGEYENLGQMNDEMRMSVNFGR